MSLHPMCLSAPKLSVKDGNLIATRGDWWGDVLVWGTRLLLMEGDTATPVGDVPYPAVPGATFRYEVQASGPRGTTIVWSEDFRVG